MEQNERMQVERHLYIAGLCIPGALAALYLVNLFLPVTLSEKFYTPCIFHAVTNLYCPGCGGTRAAWLLMQGKFFLSFLYHPVVLYGTAIYLWFMVSHTAELLSGRRIRIGMRYRNLYLYLALILVIINTAVKDIALTAFDVDLLKILDAAAGN